MKFTDTSGINELQKTSLKSTAKVIEALKEAQKAGVEEIKVTSKDAG